MTKIHPFPAGFRWGVSTSSYQIEGGVHEDGRGQSIWDTFAHTPGKIVNNDNGDVAADSYHLWQQDIELMRALGVNAYRFSIAWPRIQPEGRGAVNEAGMGYYERLVDGLLAAGITPVVTLYHWDLPQALAGGWLNRDTAFAFADYADRVSQRLGDRVKLWTTLNEPFCAAFLGYAFGIHAPGESNMAHALQASHHLLLAHGLAVPVLRANVPDAEISIVVNPAPVHAASDSEADREAARFQDGVGNRWQLDPLFGKGYPADMRADFARLGCWQETPDYVKPGDMQIIATPFDALGLNYYSRSLVKASLGYPEHPEMGDRIIPKGAAVTHFGWEIYPEGLYELLQWVHQTYAPEHMFIAENGASYPDGPDAGGTVHDVRRIDYLRSHLIQLERAIAAGLPIDGYFHWSLLDNFEWAGGYAERFGLVYVDFATRKRTVKDSCGFYKQVIAANAVEE
jgi:beta-galactosidase